MTETRIIEPDNEHDGRLGRTIVTLDDASRRYPARGILFGTEEPLRTKTWRRPTAYNQGYSSQCVVYTGKGEINSEPFRTPENYSKRRTYNLDEMYQYAQSIDEWPGESPVYEGTSVLAGHKALQHKGFISEYRWCFGLDDVLRTLSNYGCVGIGIAWYDSMFDPAENGMLTVDVNSGLAGGHAVELMGINTRYKYVIGMNSWGPEWGYNGRFRMRWEDLGSLLGDWGEALTVVR